MRVFLDWWTTQLAGLLPDIVTGKWRRTPDAVILHAGAENFTLLIRSRGVKASIAQKGPDDAGLEELAETLRNIKRAPPLLALHMPPGFVLHKQLLLPVAARHDLKNLLSFEIERETPFGLDEIYWNYTLGPHDSAQDRLTVDLVLVPRRPADALMQRLRRAGFATPVIEVETLSGTLFVPFEGDLPQPRAKPSLAISATAACALIVLGAPFILQNWAISAADTRIASLKDRALEAIALRQSSDRLMQTAEFFKTKDGGGPLAAIAAVARSLPTDAYLTALTLRGSRLTLSGLSPSAAELVGLFAHSPLFREPSFDAPVVKNEGDDLEQFTISLSLAQRGMP
jgi:general secretion pathway protein L